MAIVIRLHDHEPDISKVWSWPSQIVKENVDSHIASKTMKNAPKKKNIRLGDWNDWAY